jgi:hypothetical protein
MNEGRRYLLVVAISMALGIAGGLAVGTAVSAHGAGGESDRIVELLGETRAREAELRSSLGRAGEICGEIAERVGDLRESSGRIGELNRSAADRIRASIELVEEIRVEVALLEDDVDRLQRELGEHSVGTGLDQMKEEE